MPGTNDILKRADKLQKMAHSFIDEIIKDDNLKVSYQDAQNTWLFMFLAELQLEIEDILEKVDP